MAQAAADLGPDYTRTLSVEQDSTARGLPFTDVPGLANSAADEGGV
jgi:hypothetical protein